MLFFTPQSVRLCSSNGSRVCDNLNLANSLQNKDQFAYGKYKHQRAFVFVIVLI